jgi:hypothetical protein
MERLFPQVEHGDTHSDVGGSYLEGKTSPSHIKKEIWRTNLLTSLQGLRFPKLEIEDVGMVGREGVRVTWNPEGHTNYMIWFNLLIGEEPKVCAYTDPTLSGSTTGWLSTRLIKNENGLAKLPYTLEQWAVEDLRKKNTHPEHRRKIRELLLHHIPRDMEEAWGAIRRQLVGVPHGELHGDVGSYDESIMKRLAEVRFVTVDDLEIGTKVSIPKHNNRIATIIAIEPFGTIGKNKTVQYQWDDAPDFKGWHVMNPELSYDWKIVGHVEHGEVHSDTGAYDESLMESLNDAFS